MTTTYTPRLKPHQFRREVRDYIRLLAQQMGIKLRIANRRYGLVLRDLDILITCNISLQSSTPRYTKFDLLDLHTTALSRELVPVHIWDNDWDEQPDTVKFLIHSHIETACDLLGRAYKPCITGEGDIEWSKIYVDPEYGILVLYDPVLTGPVNFSKYFGPLDNSTEANFRALDITLPNDFGCGIFLHSAADEVIPGLPKQRNVNSELPGMVPAYDSGTTAYILKSRLNTIST
jgi:hypothetical protein